MMASYARHEEPMPRAFSLLAPDTTVVEPPQDEAGKLAFNGYREALKAKCDALFTRHPDQLASHDTRQMRAARAYVENLLLTTFREAYAQTAGTADLKAAAAQKAVRDIAPFFNDLSGDELSALGRNLDFKNAFAATLSGLVTQKTQKNPALTSADVREVFGATCARMAEKLDLMPLAKVYVAGLNLDPAQEDAAAAAILDALKAPGDGKAEVMAGMRVKLMKARADSDPNAVGNVAQTLCATSAEFREIAAAATAGFISPEALLARRNAVFAEIPNAPSAIDATRTTSSFFMPTWEEFKTFECEYGRCQKLSPEEQAACFASEKMQQIKRCLEDDVFRGKVTLLLELGLNTQPEKAPLCQGAFSGGKFSLDPDKLSENIEKVNLAVADIPLQQLERYRSYIVDGVSVGDALMVNHNGEKPLFKLVMDGGIDFSKMEMHARNLFISGLSEAYDKEGVELANRESITLAGRHVPPAALADFYREAREAARAEAATLGLNEAECQAFLVARGVASPDVPANFNPEQLVSLNGYAGKTEGHDGSALFSIRGWGTADAHQLLDLFASVGVRDLEHVSSRDWMAMFKLQYLVAAHGGKAEGVVAWSERVTGKAFDEIALGDCMPLLRKALAGETIADPLDKVSKMQAKVVAFLGGTVKTDEAGLVAGEMPAFLAALRTLANGSAQHAEITLFGERLQLARRPDGSLAAKFSDEAALSLHVTRTADDLIRQIENVMVSDVARYGALNVLSILPPAPDKTGDVARPRELYAKVLANCLRMPPAHFAHLSTVELRACAEEALKNPAGLASRFAVPPADYNNAEVVELQEKYLREDAVTRALVKLPAAPQGPSLAERQAQAPSRQAVHDFVADLFMNKDTWAFDSGNRVPGRRLRVLLETYGPELQHVKDDPALLDTLPKILRAPVRTILEKAGVIDLHAPNAAERLAALETEIDGLVDTAMAAMQEKASALFASQAGENKSLWQKSFGEVFGAGGLDVNTPNGKFTKKVLDTYFVRSASVEKRAMLAALIRNADHESSDGKLVAEMLKGAGPLLQKTLQGLPAETFGPETQKALKDMKSKLLPIPDNVIKAQLLELVKSSHGEILSVEVKKSIGQATVGQALLCHIRTKAHPVTGEDVVIKLLRPNVQTAVQREHRLFLEVARELDRETGGQAQELTFEGRYASVLEEFDFTLEAENVDLGGKIYETPNMTFDGNASSVYVNVHSMGRHPAVKPMTGMLVLQKVEGKPVDRVLEDLPGDVDRIFHGMKVEAGLPDRPVTTVYQSNSVSDLVFARVQGYQRRDQLVAQHDEVANLLDAWIENALFGDGVFHNDLHPGNVMVDGTRTTVIDFGNVMRLTKQQQQELVFMFTSALTANEADFLDAVNKLLSDAEKAKLATAKADVLRDLGEVLNKGSADDALPRLLAGMAIFQQHGISVPETVHNFIQSLARLESVMTGYETAIRGLEDTLSASTSFTADLADSFRPRENDTRPALFAQLDALLLSIGDPDAPHVPLETLRLQDALTNGLHNAKGNHNYTEVKDRRKAEVWDPLDPVHLAEEGAGEKLRTACTEIREKVFTQADGGVGFLREQLARYRGIKAIWQGGGLNGDVFHQNPIVAFDRLQDAIDAYDRILAREEPASEVELETAHRNVLRTLLQAVTDLAKGCYSPQAALKPPAMLVDFTTCVGNSLMKRTKKLSKMVAVRMGITDEKFNKVMKLMEEGANKAKLLFAVGALDANKFLKLQALSEDLEDTVSKTAHLRERRETVQRAAVKWNETLPAGQRVSARHRRVLEACARQVRMPRGWKASLETEQNVTLFQQVILANLNAARHALEPDEMTAEEAKYFARLFAAETYETGLYACARNETNKETFDALFAEFLKQRQQDDPGMTSAESRLLPAFVTTLRGEDIGMPPPPAEA